MSVAPDRRRAELGKIHILAKQLHLDDDSYRNILWAVARVHSAKDLDEFGRGAVIEQLRAKLPGAPARVRPAADRVPMLRKVYALLGDRPVAYAMGILAHMYGRQTPERLEWASSTQLHKLIAALEYDRRRRQAAAQGPH